SVDRASPLMAVLLLFFYASVTHLDLLPFPTRRSSDLERHGEADTGQGAGAGHHAPGRTIRKPRDPHPHRQPAEEQHAGRLAALQDRKSTRLNSSHEWISYAGFCLKEKNAEHVPVRRRE